MLGQKTVFLSYRRKDGAWAIAVYMALKQRGYDVFFDFKNIGSGSFNQAILENIRSRAHFLVILTPTSLQRCKRREDWLAKEIYEAISTRRNIIPLLADGFAFSAEALAQLPRRLKPLSRYNGIELTVSFFEPAIERLDTQFLQTAAPPPAAESSTGVEVDSRQAALTHALLLNKVKRGGFAPSDVLILSLLNYIEQLQSGIGKIDV